MKCKWLVLKVYPFFWFSAWDEMSIQIRDTCEIILPVLLLSRNGYDEGLPLTSRVTRLGLITRQDRSIGETIWHGRERRGVRGGVE